jgi:hypothetical protein
MSEKTLVERLRETAADPHYVFLYNAKSTLELRPLLREAADRIEQLEVEVMQMWETICALGGTGVDD